MDNPDQLDDPTYNLLFGIQRSARYHDRRRRFYEIWAEVTAAAAAVGGSAAVILHVAGQAQAVPYLAGGIAAIGALNMAVGTARRAGEHRDLARQFIALEGRFVGGRSLDAAELEEIRRERLRIEGTEPTVLRLLDVLCHYEVLRALGDQRQPPRIPWFRRALAPWLSQNDYAVRVDETP